MHSVLCALKYLSMAMNNVFRNKAAVTKSHASRPLKNFSPLAARLKVNSTALLRCEF
jgi:hypothetical protein